MRTGKKVSSAKFSSISVEKIAIDVVKEKKTMNQAYNELKDNYKAWMLCQQLIKLLLQLSKAFFEIYVAVTKKQFGEEIKNINNTIKKLNEQINTYNKNPEYAVRDYTELMDMRKKYEEPYKTQGTQAIEGIMEQIKKLNIAAERRGWAVESPEVLMMRGIVGLARGTLESDMVELKEQLNQLNFQEIAYIMELVEI